MKLKKLMEYTPRTWSTPGEKKMDAWKPDPEVWKLLHKMGWELQNGWNVQYGLANSSPQVQAKFKKAVETLAPIVLAMAKIAKDAENDPKVKAWIAKHPN